MQVLYEYIFCSGVVHSNFGIFTSYPLQLLQVVGSKKIGDVEGVLAVEEDENFLNPMEYLKDEVKHEQFRGGGGGGGEGGGGGGSRTRSKVPQTEH